MNVTALKEAPGRALNHGRNSQGARACDKKLRLLQVHLALSKHRTFPSVLSSIFPGNYHPHCSVNLDESSSSSRTRQGTLTRKQIVLWPKSLSPFAGVSPTQTVRDVIGGYGRSSLRRYRLEIRVYKSNPENEETFDLRQTDLFTSLLAPRTVLSRAKVPRAELETLNSPSNPLRPVHIVTLGRDSASITSLVVLGKLKVNTYLALTPKRYRDDIGRRTEGIQVRISGGRMMSLQHQPSFQTHIGGQENSAFACAYTVDTDLPTSKVAADAQIGT
ncbi:hypothetical protein ARMGADRAFT_1031941 [Armillaria gallica]|uniref:Uncharacterized protein n=1 Tax=Armillaria gallica TaxID=47427 RepID=A0A2H3D7R2_ARMGA|nr:hypothetical protein ARMGADRAFT_1031941 [Armillaria gallica]